MERRLGFLFTKAVCPERVELFDHQALVSKGSLNGKQDIEEAKREKHIWKFNIFTEPQIITGLRFFLSKGGSAGGNFKIKPRHASEGRSIAAVLKDRLDYDKI
ncbi:MAG: hypothetical protein ACLUKO_20375 [Enterocloster bolteae]